MQKKLSVLNFLRPVSCLYSKVGCNWNGAAHMLSQHVEECAAQHRTCREVISTISKNEKKYEDEVCCFLFRFPQIL